MKVELELRAAVDGEHVVNIFKREKFILLNNGVYGLYMRKDEREYGYGGCWDDDGCLLAENQEVCV